MSTQMPTVYPPMHGTIRPAALVDFYLEHNPTHKLYVYSEAPGALVEISFLEFGRAAHRAGHLLRPKRSGPENEVVASIANVDILLYQTLVAGMMRAGLVPFPIAPRNSAEAVVSMLQKTGCHRILTTSTTLGNLIAQIKSLTSADSALAFEDAPTFSQCYPYLGQETPSHLFTPYSAPQAPLDLDQILFLPTLVTSSTSVAPFWLGGMHLALFRGLSMVMQLFVPLATGITVVIYPPISLTDHNTPPAVPTTDTAMEHSKRTGVTALVAVPSFLETWCLDAEDGYGGGPLARKIGDALSADGVAISCLYGATEFGFVRQADGAFDSQFLDTEAHKLRVLNLPDVKGYASNDLWEPHPTKANSWRIIGRLDDVIILASGKNMVPGPLETVIMSSPAVNGVVIFGRGRNQVGVLIERTPGAAAASDVVEFRNIIWPIVEEANKEAPFFSRIFKEMIIVTDGNKPLPRVAKHTVAKKAAMKLYAAEIDALYETVEASLARGQAEDIHSAQLLDVDTDLFLKGFDSLSATLLRNRITGTLRSSQLSTHIAHLVSSADAGPASATLAIEKMIEKYSVGLRRSEAAAAAAPVVLLIGSTGELGSYTLETLMKALSVERVYAYNRSASGAMTGQDRQRDAFADKGFELRLLQSDIPGGG
ncbi:acetyl-CoA synthetase-like protein [Athelia psychrophila]|uniref:Acetyl-CoA synthetase-like protein n=1 Tax=Athelia psychrophila TaxID=1759441 RepID=A0A166CDL3_9AGAM|nr:acetyl-CoA synthetase-like protein [Fibularhizoctonia sp. CBS 109695]